MHAAGRKIPADYASAGARGPPGQNGRERDAARRRRRRGGGERERETTEPDEEPAEPLPEREKVKRGRQREARVAAHDAEHRDC